MVLQQLGYDQLQVGEPFWVVIILTFIYITLTHSILHLLKRALCHKGPYLVPKVLVT